MKDSVKKFFLLGLGIAAAGVAVGIAYKNRDKIKKAVDDLIHKDKLTKDDGEHLTDELLAELKKAEELTKKRKPAVKKVVPKKKK